MENYEITGDWMSLSEEEYKELLSAAQEFNSENIRGFMMQPGITRLNLDLRSSKGEREIRTMEILSDSEIEDADCKVKETVFRVKGDTAFFVFTMTMSFKGEEIQTSGGISTGLRMGRDVVETIFTRDLFVFALIQYLLLHGAEKISDHKEFCRALKPDKASHLIGPYTLPGKVRVLEINATGDELREYIRKESKVHNWHCPAWGVRGHFRHYSTGKVSYVKPYVKGRDKAAYVGREYTTPSGEAIKMVKNALKA